MVVTSTVIAVHHLHSTGDHDSTTFSAALTSKGLFGLNLLLLKLETEN